LAIIDQPVIGKYADADRFYSMQTKFSPQARFSKIQQEIDSLLSETPYKVGQFVKEKEYEKTRGQHGIYAFTDPDDHEIVYIGMSTRHKNGIGGRARHHERKNRGLQRKLAVNQERFREYNVRIHRIDDPDLRA
jgi:hypothetical protein